MTLVTGVEIKGARRWIALPGMSLQPSEFLKPCFAVVAAWLLSEGKRTRGFPGMAIAFGVFGLILLLLKSQPDIGMLAVVTAVFFAQLFVGGLNLFFVGVGAAPLLVASGVGAYAFFPHVRSRVTRFLDPAAGDSYQVNTALEAFGNGGLLGRGPGEGRVKDVLPDAHADFVFAVVGEEFGMVVCLLVLCLFAFIVMRGLLRLLAEHDEFVILASAGLVASFGLAGLRQHGQFAAPDPDQGHDAAVRQLRRIVVLAVALGMGMLLALTRRRHHGDVP